MAEFAGGASFALCDGCYGPLSRWVWIVPGAFTVTSKCEGCGRFVNSRELDPANSRPGGHGKRDLVSTGLCFGCAVP